ncbi:DUF4397 domain-containing protein [Marinobacter salexigens]|uniref:DUF4397 domain-containing protein n=1 Tax=Marinobacter salexigens TaxID=1925763 RepID=UPI000C286B83|nr:DUF4397 domain-containing protein [Marinobacter salexigens]
MKTKYALTMVLAGSLMLVGCSDDDDDSVAQEPMSKVRVLHASPDAPAVDVAIDGNVVLTGVKFQQGTGYLYVPAGTREISVQVGGADVLIESFALDEGRFYSIIAQDSVASLDLEALDDTERRANGTIDVTVVHASPDAGSVDVNVTAPGAALPAMPTLPNVPFGANATLDPVPAADYQVRIAGAGGSDIVYDSGALAIASDVTVVAVNSVKGVSPVSLLVWAESDPVVTAVLSNSAEVRIVHAVEDVTVDVFVDGEEAKGDFLYGTNTPYLVLPAGDRDVAVAPANGGIGGALATLGGTLTLERGESYTVIAAGDVNQLSKTRLIVLADRRAPSDAAQADVRLVHAAAAPEAQPVDIFVLPAGGPVMGEPTFPDVLLGKDTGYVTVPAATYDVTIAADGTTMAAVPGTQGLDLPAGSVTTAIAIGASVGSLEALLLEDRREALTP